MPKKKIKKTSNRIKPEIGDFVEVELIDSGATWGKSLDSPQQLALSRLRWAGYLVRQDKDITAVDAGGTVADENYSRRYEYHIAWTPSVKNVKLIRKCRKNRR